ncbi:peptidoglycan-binding domain-containing protein [Paracoccus zeaxanthinifaciens]|uniref:peptidoglycan-binding domain-containing protein n=1 Tax=Paracoccus zeaxanthinifaciens TaxID=187400 RepID=UPI0003F53436|nr:peptidoglycan-binding domain-containing protein [Paracoccus zeaxanthinifaciens]
MRQIATLFMAAMIPVPAMAEDAVIRIEAKRGAEEASVAAGAWAETLDGVVTLDLGNGWTGIAIGPLDRADADARLAQLKAAGAVPDDSFVSVPAPGMVLVPVGDAAPTEIAPPPDVFLALSRAQDEAAARQALGDVREEFPDAGLHALADGGFAVTLGPLAPAAAQAWLPVLTDAGAMPAGATVIEAQALGDALQPGQAPDLPAPGARRPMPPLAEVQAMLAWAGHYDGAIDGQDGPRTQAAIRAEIAQNRASTDPGTAMEALKQRQQEWRDELGLSELRDEVTGLSVIAPRSALEFDRAERALSIWGPKDGSGAALILFSQKGGQQELLDLAGLVTALGWVPNPKREIANGSVRLKGANDAHIGVAQGRVQDGRAEGWVLIWPASDAQNQARIEAEMAGSLTRHAPARNDTPGATLP